MNNLRVAYYGLDRCGKWTVMLCGEHYPADNPGRSESSTLAFIEAGDEERAKSIADSMKARGEAQLVRRLN